jgi:hypothetical protein
MYMNVLSRYLSIFYPEHETGWNDPVSYTKEDLCQKIINHIDGIHTISDLAI